MKRIFPLLTLLLAMTACHQNRLPMIGISCSRSTSGSTTLNTTYTDAITRAGGVPVVLPTISTPEMAAELLSRLDGIVFSGGEDVEPARYGEAVWNETVYIDPLRDASDFLLAEAALDSGKPILAICRGSQLMNVVLGGTLYQDIPSQLPESLKHGGGASHKIGVEKGSILYGLYNRDSLEVNSSHHQAVKDPAPGIHITAYSSDGIVEAFETAQVTAYQFHPEKMLPEDASWLVLFQQWVDVVRKRL